MTRHPQVVVSALPTRMYPTPLVFLRCHQGFRVDPPLGESTPLTPRIPPLVQPLQKPFLVYFPSEELLPPLFLFVEKPLAA